MTSKKNKARAPKELNPKKFKKKTSLLVTEKVGFIDYKDVNLLNRFVSDRSKIRNRRVTGNSVQQQREIANAIKNAREMALIPYAKRVAQARTGRPSRDGEGRRDRSEGAGERTPDAAVTSAVTDATVEIEIDDVVEVEA